MTPIRKSLRRLTPHLVAVTVCVALAGCGQTSRTITIVQRAVPASQSPAPPAASNTIDLSDSSEPTACTVYLSGNYAAATFSSASLQVDPECRDFITAEAQGGNLWSDNAGASPSGGADEPTICSLIDAGGQVTATISDTGGAFFGTAACTALISSGWSEQPPDATTDNADTSAEESGTYCDPQHLYCAAQGSVVAGGPGPGAACVLDDGTPGTMETNQAVCERP
jgi:hypothetical protein